MNSRTHADAMVYSCDMEPGSHPFWWSRILGIFHADVDQRGYDIRNRSVQRLEFLWVRLFGTNVDHKWGLRHSEGP